MIAHMTDTSNFDCPESDGGMCGEEAGGHGDGGGTGGDYTHQFYDFTFKRFFNDMFPNDDEPLAAASSPPPPPDPVYV
jgi:hypothetical protein